MFHIWESSTRLPTQYLSLRTFGRMSQSRGALVYVYGCLFLTLIYVNGWLMLTGKRYINHRRGGAGTEVLIGEIGECGGTRGPGLEIGEDRHKKIRQHQELWSTERFNYMCVGSNSGDCATFNSSG